MIVNFAGKSSFFGKKRAKTAARKPQALPSSKKDKAVVEEPSLMGESTATDVQSEVEINFL